MKKKILMITAIVMATMVTACGQYKGPCESCGETKPLYELTLTGSASIFGNNYSESETYEVCKSCLDAMVKEADNYQSQFGESVTYSYEKIKK